MGGTFISIIAHAAPSVLTLFSSLVVPSTTRTFPGAAEDLSQACTAGRAGGLEQQKCYDFETFTRNDDLEVPDALQRFFPQQDTSIGIFDECSPFAAFSAR